MKPKHFDELKASVKQGGILHDLEAEYDELVRLRDENAEFLSDMVKIEKLSVERYILLSRAINYLRHHIEAHKCYDWKDAQALVTEYDGLQNE